MVTIHGRRDPHLSRLKPLPQLKPNTAATVEQPLNLAPMWPVVATPSGVDGWSLGGVAEVPGDDSDWQGEEQVLPLAKGKQEGVKNFCRRVLEMR